MINVYDPEFVGDQLTKLYETGFGGGADRVLVRFLAMVNAGFLPATIYAKDSVLEAAAKPKKLEQAMKLAGEALGRIAEVYREIVGEETLAGLDKYFAGLDDSGALRFSLADRNHGKIIRDKAMLTFFSEPDALESGRFHFIPLNDTEPKGLRVSGWLEGLTYSVPSRRPSYVGGSSTNWYMAGPSKMKYSLHTYPERKDPAEIAKMAGEIFKLPAELFLATEDLPA